MRRIIVIGNILLAALVFVAFMAGRASACESFEECMDKDVSLGKADLIVGPEWILELKQAVYLKAIAFKLDEISKKLEEK